MPAGLCVNIEPLSSLDEVLPLLAGCDLPVADLSSSPSPPYFFGVRAAGALVGVVGLEIFQSIGLLRSLAIRRISEGAATRATWCASSSVLLPPAGLS